MEGFLRVMEGCGIIKEIMMWGCLQTVRQACGRLTDCAVMRGGKDAKKVRTEMMEKVEIFVITLCRDVE